MVKYDCMAHVVDLIVESSFHNYSPTLAGSLEDTHFVVGFDFVKVFPKVVETEVSGIVVVYIDRKLQLIHMDKCSKSLELTGLLVENFFVFVCPPDTP